MSVAYHEEEPVDEWQGFCNMHGEYYERQYGCVWCADEQVDRAISDIYPRPISANVREGKGGSMNLELEVPDEVAEFVPDVSIETLTKPTDLGHQLQVYKGQTLSLIPTDALSVKRCAAFVETCKVASKHAETQRKALVDPLNKQVKEHNEVWMPISKGFDDLWREVDGRLSRFAYQQKQEAIAQQQREIQKANEEKRKLDQQAEEARKAAAAAETPQEAAKLQAKAERFELKSEMVVAPVVPMESKTIDLGDSTLGVKDPKPQWVLAGYDGKKPLSLLDPLLSSIVGDLSALSPALVWLISNSEVNPVLLNASLKAPGGAARFPKPFAITDKFGSSTLRGSK